MKKEINENKNRKFVINDKLALGYGSKYQLLRMVGFHKNFFSYEISLVTKTTYDINYFDFSFNGYEDEERLNFEFLPELDRKWKEFYSCGSGGINWDLVGKTYQEEYLLIEAKAHKDEFVHPVNDMGGSIESKTNNLKRINEVLHKYGVKSTAEKWCELGHYQLANRIVATDFMLSNNYEAKLVYIFFSNGYEFNTPENKSLTSSEWKKVIKEEFDKLGITGSKLEKFINVVIIDCNRKQEKHFNYYF